MRHAISGSLIFVAIGCGESSAPPRAPVVHPIDAGVAAVPVKHTMRWSNIDKIETCFYFSGPFDGRDDSLDGEIAFGVHEGELHVSIGDVELVGPIHDGEVTLRRAPTHQYEGSWTVTETITGTYDGATLRGRYRYEECGPGEVCPGHCTLTADLTSR